MEGWAFSGGDYPIAVYNVKFLAAETEKIKSFDELRRLLRHLDRRFAAEAGGEAASALPLACSRGLRDELV